MRPAIATTESVERAVDEILAAGQEVTAEGLFAGGGEMTP